jgi:UDP-glucose 4-epimerase
MYPNVFTFLYGDIRDMDFMRNIFQTYTIQTVLHMAALKSVKESFEKKEEYYSVNVIATIRLVEIMNEFHCKHIVYSSSATVYGNSPSPITEDSKIGVGITNPYGQTKYDVEEFLNQLPNMKVVIFRYFNPIGAHSSGKIGELPRGSPNNVFPIILQCAKNKNPFTIFGNTYSTDDGTPVRDYIDVEDLADAHAKICFKYSQIQEGIPFIMNLGNGYGVSVKKLLETFQAVTNTNIDTRIGTCREGDIGELWARVSDEKKNWLNWHPSRSLEDSCKKGWTFINNLSSLDECCSHS